MIFKWETEEGRILRFMKIPPFKKLELLYEMHRFMRHFSSKKANKIRQQLRKLG